MTTSISVNLKYFRKANKLTQLEMATSLFVTPQAVSKWERGESLPDISLIPEIANLFQISISDLWQERMTNLQENSNHLNDTVLQFMKAERLEEINNYFDSFLLLDETQKEQTVFKLLSLHNSDFLIEDYYYYLSSRLKELVVLSLLNEKRYLALETLIPMMSSKIRDKVLANCLANQEYEFLDELFPFLTFTQKQKIIEKVSFKELEVTELENYLTFFTEKQRIMLKQLEEDYYE